MKDKIFSSIFTNAAIIYIAFMFGQLIGIYYAFGMPAWLAYLTCCIIFSVNFISVITRKRFFIGTILLAISMWLGFNKGVELSLYFARQGELSSIFDTIILAMIVFVIVLTPVFAFFKKNKERIKELIFGPGAFESEDEVEVMKDSLTEDIEVTKPQLSPEDDFYKDVKVLEEITKDK